MEVEAVVAPRFANGEEDGFIEEAGRIRKTILHPIVDPFRRNGISGESFNYIDSYTDIRLGQGRHK